MFINIIKTKILYNAESKIKTKKEKEHLTYFFMKNFKKIKSLNILAAQKHKNKNLRLTLDFPEDFKVIKFFYNKLKKNRYFELSKIISLSIKNKRILNINKKFL